MGGGAERTPAGGWRAKPDLLKTLERQELPTAGAAMAAEKGLVFQQQKAGETVRGKLTGSLQLASGRYGVVEDNLLRLHT